MKGYTQENRKKVNERPENDFYQTPKCMTWELLNTGYLNDCKTILDPCCGKYAISNILQEKGFIVDNKDLIYGNDFLKDTYNKNSYDAIVMNPPFKNWDDFVYRAKDIAKKVCVIGKMNFFGSHSRNIDGLWNNLEYIYIFDRQIAYDRPFREDGRVECGMLITGWFLFNKDYKDLPKLKVIDMQKYILSKRENNNGKS